MSPSLSPSRSSLHSPSPSPSPSLSLSLSFSISPTLSLPHSLSLLFMLFLSSCTYVFSEELNDKNDNHRSLQQKHPHYDWWRDLPQNIEKKTVKNNKNSIRAVGRELHSFAFFSAYRDSLTEFYAVGLSSSTLKKVWGDPVTRCEWLPNGETMEQRGADLVIASSVEILPAGRKDGQSEEYTPVIIKCTFPKEVGVKLGGTLFLRVPRHASSKHAHIVAKDDMVPILYEENKINTSQDPSTEKDKRFHKKYTICGAPMRSNLNSTLIREWFLWHQALLQDGVQFFVYVVQDLQKDMWDLLRGFEIEGILTIIEVKDQSLYESWYYNQVLFINDCIHRSRHVSEWAIDIDYDEFLHVPSESQTLSNFFDFHKDDGVLLFRRIRFSIGYCLPQIRVGEWAIRLRAFRQKSRDLKCDDFNMRCHVDGPPKWAINLNTGIEGGVHGVWKIQNVSQVKVSESYVYIVHARELPVQTKSECFFIVDNTTMYTNIIMDRSFSDRVGRLVDERHWEHKPLSRN